MRRTICALMLLGAVGGCGSDDEEVGTTADRQPPTVAITAASTAEGGETVPLSVTVTDNVDSGLTPTIACTGGSLTGTLLVTPLVTATTNITCTATAVDKAGNTGTGTVTIAVRPSTASLSVLGGTNTITQGKLLLLQAQNLSLSNATYTGTIGGKSVTLARTEDGSSLLFSTPEGLAAGTQTLNVTVGARTFTFDFQNQAPPTISDPRQVVLDYLNSSKSNALAFLAARGSSLNATAKDNINTNVAKIQTAIDAIGTASASDLQALAIYIRVNGFDGVAAGGNVATSGLFGPQAAASPFAYDQRLCDRSASNFLAGVSVSVLGVIVANGGVAAGFTGVGIGVGAAGLLLIYIGLEKVIDPAIDGILKNCFEDLGTTITSYSGGGQSGRVQAARYVTPVAAAGRLTFTNDRAATFRLTNRRSLLQSIAASVQAATQRLNAFAVSNNYVSANLTSLVQKVGGYDINAPANSVSLSNVTSGVSGTISAAASDVIALKFKADNPTSEMIDFAFTLGQADGNPLTVDATLSLSLPKVNDASVTTTQGQAIASTLQVSGADTLEVVTQPTLGSVTLQSNGAFTYTPNGQSFGSDKFTYRGRNANGVSATATVLITVARKFDGTWRVTSRTTTTSQSQPNLCPNETSNFTISVNKVSDVQYTTSYQGFPITLSMSSADDPAGLSGTATATYPDDPGTSTDTINVQIPNSTTLTGTGSFSYTGPNNTRCSGTIAISGAR